MSRLKAKLWFALFSSWGQYFREHKYRTFILSNLTNMAIWALSFMYFNNIIIGTNSSPISFFIFIGSLKGLISTMEKYIDYPIPYTLSHLFPLSKIEILQIRIINKYSWPSELFLIGVVVYHFVKNQYAMIIIPVYIVFIVLTEELIAFISYKYKISIQLIIISLELIVSAFLLSFFISNMLYVLALNLLMLLVATLIKQVCVKAKRNDKVKRSQNLSKISISLYKQLCLKEYIFLFKYKKSILLGAFIFPIIFIIADSQPNTPVFYALFFIFEFALNYGFNYLGVEKEDLVPILTLSDSYHMLIRIKSLYFVANTLLGTFLIFIIHAAFFTPSLMSILSSVPKIIIAISFFCFLSNWNSINNYPFKIKQTIYKFISGLGVFIILTGMNELIVYNPQISTMYYFGCLFISLICIYFSFINVDYFSHQLNRQTKPILQALIKDT